MTTLCSLLLFSLQTYLQLINKINLHSRQLLTGAHTEYLCNKNKTLSSPFNSLNIIQR